jgi:hypothetical protein
VDLHELHETHGQKKRVVGRLTTPMNDAAVFGRKCGAEITFSREELPAVHSAASLISCSKIGKLADESPNSRLRSVSCLRRASCSTDHLEAPMFAMRTALATTLLIAVASTIACATATATDLRDIVKTRAAFDLKCEAGELTLTELSGGQSMSNGFAATEQKSYGVDGCGQRTSYYAYCTNMLGKESCEAMPGSLAAR